MPTSYDCTHICMAAMSGQHLAPADRRPSGCFPYFSFPLLFPADRGPPPVAAAAPVPHRHTQRGRPPLRDTKQVLRTLLPPCGDFGICSTQWGPSVRATPCFLSDISIHIPYQGVECRI